MRLALVSDFTDDGPRPALVEDRQCLSSSQPNPIELDSLLQMYLRHGETEVKERLLESAEDIVRVPIEEVSLKAPLATDGRLFCMGGAYTSHLREQERSLFTVPHQWYVPETAVIGSGTNIELPGTVSDEVLPAVELAIVIGKGGSYINESRAMDHVCGYTITNDITARTEWPGPRGYKIMDTFSPCGPYIRTSDEIDNPLDLEMSVRLDGETICSGTTAGHRFTLSFIVSYLSTIYELRPGDIISTGDPGGVSGCLEPGSTVEVEVENIGTLSNGVVRLD